MNHKPIQFKDLSLNYPLVSFIRHFLKPYKPVVVLFVLLALLAGFWGPFNSILVKSFINTLTVKTTTDLSSLYWIAGLLVLNFIVFDNITWRTLGYLNYKYEAQIKIKLLVKPLSMCWDQARNFSRIIYRGELLIKLLPLLIILRLCCIGCLWIFFVAARSWWFHLSRPIMLMPCSSIFY